MTAGKMRVVLAAVLVSWVLVQSLRAQAPQPAAPGSAEADLPSLLKGKPLKEDRKDDELHRLLKERYNEAIAEVAVLRRKQMAGVGGVDEVYWGAWRRVAEAGLELKDTPKEKAAFLRQYIEALKDIEKLTAAQVKAGIGRVGQEGLHRARYYRLDAEIRLLRLQKAK